MRSRQVSRRGRGHTGRSPAHIALVTLTVAALVVLGTGAPASATVVTVPVTAGTLRLGSGAGAVDLVLPGGCAANDVTIDLTTSWLDVTVLSWRVPVTVGGVGFVADVSLLATAPGSLAGANPATVTSLDLTLQVDLFAATGGSCTPGAHRCSLAAGLLLDGSYSGNPGALTPGDVLALAGVDYTTLVAVSSCTSPFSTLIGDPAEIIGLTANDPPNAVSGDITGGSITIGSTSMGLPGTCPTDAADAALSTASVEITDLVSRVVWTYLGTNYVVDISYVSSLPGDVSGGGPAVLGSNQPLELGLELDISTRTGSCTPNVLRCEAAFVFAGAGTFTGNPGAPATGDSMVIGGPGTVGGLQAVGSCAAPISALLNDPVTVTALTITLD